MPPAVAPWSCAGCRADLGSIAVATETEADVTLVAGRLAGALIITVTKMQLDGTSSVFFHVEERRVCVRVWAGEGLALSELPSPTSAGACTHTHNHTSLRRVTPRAPRGLQVHSQ